MRERILEEHNRWKERYDAGHSKPVKYTVGEVVFLRKPPEYTGESTKLQSKFRGPLVIMKMLPNDAYRVAAVRTNDGRQYATTAHVGQLKGFHLSEDMEYMESTEECARSDSTEEEVKAVTEAAEIDEGQTRDNEPNKTERQKRRPEWLKDFELY